MKHHFSLLSAYLLFIATQSCATIIVPGDNESATSSFSSVICAKAFDRATGTFVVGLSGNKTGKFALSRANQPTKNSSPIFNGIAPKNLFDQTIELLTLSHEKNNITALVVAAAEKPFSANTITAVSIDGKQSTTTAPLFDASGEKETAGIVAITASATTIFAAVRPANGNFGSDGSGIAAIPITRSAQEGVTLAANTSHTVAQLNSNSLAITGNTNPVRFTGEENNVVLYFDPILDTLYCGLQLQANSKASSIAKAIVCTPLQSADNFVLQEIVANCALTDATSIITTKVAGTYLTIKHLRVLHASTGPSYLIVNGGAGSTNDVSNKLWAFPLVDSLDKKYHGSLANKNSPLSQGKFISPALRSGDLCHPQDSAVMIGGGLLPISSKTPISDIDVVGDTVYVSFANQLDKNNETGVFYSQALYDAQGKIVRWTPWTKRAIPFNAFPSTPLSNNLDHDGRIKFFSVDSTTGNIWVVEGTTGRTVGITACTIDASLITEISRALPHGCYAALDLDQATQGFLSTTAHRYALFGGIGKIVITRVSEAFDKNSPTSPQIVTADFAHKKNFLATTLNTHGSRVIVLEYSKRGAPDTNFFFAGTEQGLFIFAQPNGEGFLSTEMNTLDNYPFSTGIWHNIPAISGDIIDVKCAGNALYVVTSEMSIDKPFTNTVYTIPFCPLIDDEPVSHSNIASLFAKNNIHTIAQTGAGIFKNVTSFCATAIISTGRDNAQDNDSVEKREQLILATSNGLFKTNANQQDEVSIIFTGTADTKNQESAQWSQIPTTTTTFMGIGSLDTPVQHTVWPFTVEDKEKRKFFNHGSLHQISGSEDLLLDANQSKIGTYNPEHFTSNDTSFALLDRIAYFWTDGARRFFIFYQNMRNKSSHALGILPFCPDSSIPTEPIIFSDPIINTLSSFFWIKTIGATGFILAGTNKGLIGLG